MNRIYLRMPALSMAAGLGLVLVLGCNREDHHHDDEPKTAQITVWGERHEIFAEHRFVVAGAPTKFVMHVTDLKTLEPRREGPIKFVLRQANDAPIEQVEKEPTRAGIYEAMLSFPRAGDWNVSVSIPTEEGDKMIALPPIKVFATKHDADHAEEPEAPEGVSFLKEQQWKILSKAEPVTKRKLVERVQVPAQVRAKPGFSAAVTAPLAGQLALPPGKTLPQPGKRVEAGEVLALLQPRFSDAAARFVEIEAEFGRAEAVLKQAETAFERTKKLAREQAKSERELQEAEVALATAKARHAAAASLRSTYAAKPSGDNASQSASPALELRAPIAGVVTTVKAGIGEPVAADQIVFTILNPATVWIEARVPEAAAARLGDAKDALCELPGDKTQLISIIGEAGRLVFAGLEVDAATRTIPLIYELNNSDSRLRVGQAIRLHVETARAEETIAIPDSAIVEEAGQPIAFVQLSGETFDKRELKLGIRDGNFVQVLDGLKEGDRVVTKGAYAIRLSSVSGVIPAHGHAH
jgi:membrane fusion protein, heavy metal efflux system